MSWEGVGEVVGGGWSGKGKRTCEVLRLAGATRRDHRHTHRRLDGYGWATQKGLEMRGAESACYNVVRALLTWTAATRGRS
jgi:hypothetical protein